MINCEITLELVWYANCIILSNFAANQATAFGITDRKLYFSVVALSTQENVNLFQIKF